MKHSPSSTLHAHVIGLAAVFLLVVVAGCGETPDEDTPLASGTYEGDNSLVVDLEFDPDPPTSGEVDLSMDVTVGASPLEDATIDIEPWMPAHGHGSNTEPVVHHESDGHYRVDDLTFSMAGQWELRIDVDWDDGDSELIVELEVEG